MSDILRTESSLITCHSSPDKNQVGNLINSHTMSRKVLLNPISNLPGFAGYATITFQNVAH